MWRTFEYDDYPISGPRLIRLLDDLKGKFHDFKATVFAIPGAMTDKQWKPLLRREHFVNVCPHGIVHQKRECRDRDVYTLRMHWLDKIAEEKRYTKLFKAPWHGLDWTFMNLMKDRGFDCCVGALDFRIPFPTPDVLTWSLKDARTFNGGVGRHTEAHAVIPGRGSWYNKRFQQIDRRNVHRFTREWSEDDEWRYVTDLMHPLCRKVYLGCGDRLIDGWDNLDPRSYLDPRIIRWEAPERIPYIPNRVDVILTGHMFNYLDDEWYEPVCREMFRVLRPGGLARLQEDETSKYVWRRPGQRARGTGTIRSLPTKERILSALQSVGFDVRESAPGETSSPHNDVLLGDTREMRWRRGHKYVLEAVKPANLEPRPREGSESYRYFRRETTRQID